MFTVKNLQETAAGHLKCEILNGESWVCFTMSVSDEYEIHESSDWSDIKLCDPAEKTAHEARQAQDLINQEATAYLDHTDKFFTRLSETGKAMPEGMAEARSEARERIKV